MKKIASKKILIVLVIVLTLTGIVGYFFFFKNDNNLNKSPDSNINYGPPTKEEAAAGDEQKTTNEAREKAVQNNKPATTANIVLVDANQYFETVEVRGYISNIYENGGTCTATFTQDEKTIKQSTSAQKDATTTQCGAIDIPRSKFPSGGQWIVVLNYSSDKASGSSSPQNITIK